MFISTVIYIGRKSWEAKLEELFYLYCYAYASKKKKRKQIKKMKQNFTLLYVEEDNGNKREGQSQSV